MASHPPSSGPSSGRDETHYEGLARMITARDRRIEPFHYLRYPPQSERRRWDAVASFAASRGNGD